jgi:hypothetical protein
MFNFRKNEFLKQKYFHFFQNNEHTDVCRFTDIASVCYWYKGLFQFNHLLLFK